MFPSKSRRCPCRRRCRQVRAHLVLLEALNHRSCRRCCRRVRAHLVLLEALNHRSCRRCCRRVRAHLVLLEALNHRSCGRRCRLLIFEIPNSSVGCVTEEVAAKVQSGPILPDVLESVGRRLFLQFVVWLLSRLFYCYFDLMMFVTFALADSLQRSCSELPFRERMQMCRSLRLWYSMRCPPPLSLNDDGDKCEFAAEQCKAKSVGETPCCASRRCAKHAQEEKYVCNCWIVQASTSRKSGMPERRMQQKDVKQRKCGMPKLPRDPQCADCQTGVIICKHRGKCNQPVYIACPSCSRDRCGT